MVTASKDTAATNQTPLREEFNNSLKRRSKNLSKLLEGDDEEEEPAARDKEDLDMENDEVLAQYPVAESKEAEKTNANVSVKNKSKTNASGSGTLKIISFDFLKIIPEDLALSVAGWPFFKCKLN